MKHFYKPLKRQIFILIVYTLATIFYEYFFLNTINGVFNPLLLIPFFAILHAIILLVYATSNHQENRKKLKNYLLTTPIIIILSIVFTFLSLYLNY